MLKVFVFAPRMLLAQYVYSINKVSNRIYFNENYVVNLIAVSECSGILSLKVEHVALQQDFDDIFVVVKHLCQVKK